MQIFKTSFQKLINKKIVHPSNVLLDVKYMLSLFRIITNLEESFREQLREVRTQTLAEVKELYEEKILALEKQVQELIEESKTKKPITKIEKPPGFSVSVV